MIALLALSITPQPINSFLFLFLFLFYYKIYLWVSSCQDLVPQWRLSITLGLIDASPRDEIRFRSEKQGLERGPGAALAHYRSDVATGQLGRLLPIEPWLCLASTFKWF
jgi:hypothetical protein